MSKIKSALELALERTADVEVDREAVRKDMLNRKGREMAARYLKEPDPAELKKEIEGVDRKDRKVVLDGAVDTVLSNLTLPRYETDLQTLPSLEEALGILTGDKKLISTVMGQYKQLFSQFLENLKLLEEQLRTQWEPRLREKEQQVAQQTGRAVQLTPDQDPEFLKVLSDEIMRMENQYADVLKQGKDEIRRLI